MRGTEARIAALRAMTVANGCTPAEAAVAAAFLQRLLSPVAPLQDDIGAKIDALLASLPPREQIIAERQKALRRHPLISVLRYIPGTIGLVAILYLWLMTL